MSVCYTAAMNVLGLKCVGHDTGAALISDGKVVAIAEERLNRKKHSTDCFPFLAIDYCLKEFGLKDEDVDLIVTDRVKRDGFADPAVVISNNAGNRFKKAKVSVINHQDAHAASAFFCSPFEMAGILIYDGFGEEFKTRFGVTAVETETLYVGLGNKFYQIQKTLHRTAGNYFPDTFGIGLLYTRLSEKYIGLGRYNEGKMMGLASYGDESLLEKFPMEKWFREENGHIICNARIESLPRPMAEVFKKGGVKAMVGNLVLRFKRAAGFVFPFIRHRGAFEKITLPRAARGADVQLPDPYYASVARAGQKILEEVTSMWAKKLFEIVRLPHLTIAGGVGLNIDANRRILDESGFKKLFIQPAASDTGIALGCALYGYHIILNLPRFFEMKNASLGRFYSMKGIESALAEFQSDLTYERSASVSAFAAKHIANGKIVAWFQGGSEYGPRALGNRSILCEARKVEMKDIMNNRVKHREWWRPFAAAVLREDVNEFFDFNGDSPFMIMAAKARESKRNLIPSVVHVDGTTRLQTVTAEDNGRYYDLIKEYKRLTGIPVILNTSFNLAGEPIVETPRDALDSFLRTDIDYLIIEDFIVQKKSSVTIGQGRF